MGSNLTECELCEALKASVFHAHSKLIDLSSNRVYSFEHLLVFESLDEVFKDPDIAEDEAIVRDYALAPQLVGDDSEGALRLLLQFGLPPKAWPRQDD